VVGQPLAAPISGIAASTDGNGYRLVGRGGGVFAFGDAPFVGSGTGSGLTAPVVGLAPTQTGQGYWLAATNGGHPISAMPPIPGM